MRYAALLSLLALLSLAQCGLASQEPPASSALSEEAARQRAIEVAAMGGPEIEAAEAAPQIRAITRTTWQEAQAGEGDLPSISGREPTLEVWVVELAGEWSGGMPAPEITPTPARFTSAVIVLDARTGETITTIYRP